VSLCSGVSQYFAICCKYVAVAKAFAHLLSTGVLLQKCEVCTTPHNVEDCSVLHCVAVSPICALLYYRHATAEV